jgi:hypothetical protein
LPVNKLISGKKSAVGSKGGKSANDNGNVDVDGEGDADVEPVNSMIRGTMLRNIITN